MDVVHVLHMNAANRKCSYADNSTHQKTVMLKARKVLEEAIKDYGSHGFPKSFKLADLGCSTGPNTLSLVANVVDNVHALCQQKKFKAPDEFQVFLNDLPNNDFNAVFKMTPQFYSNLENEIGPERSESCFICGVPGSFYKRLFPSKSLHFVHSSYSVHWLSQSISAYWMSTQNIQTANHLVQQQNQSGKPFRSDSAKQQASCNLPEIPEDKVEIDSHEFNSGNIL